MRTAQEAIAAGTPDLSGFRQTSDNATRLHQSYLNALRARQGAPTAQRSRAQSQAPAASVGGGGSAQQYARQRLSQLGFTDPKEWDSLFRLWQKESSWNPNAVNKSSGAFGIAQILPSAHPAAKRNMSAQEQIEWGLNYIKNRYGSPSAAWAHSQRTNWY